MKILVGWDDRGKALAGCVCQWLAARPTFEVLPLAGDRPYYEVAWEAGQQISSGQAERAVLVCGSGMGMAIVANKSPGVYASVCENSEAARQARSINNSNVLTLGQGVTSEEGAREIVEVWLDTPFNQGWPAEIEQFLKDSMVRIAALEKETFA